MGARGKDLAAWHDTTIIIPTYNEEQNIGQLLPVLLRQYQGVSILVVDDDSTDRTAQVVRRIAGEKHPSAKAVRGAARVRLLQNKGRRQRGLTASVVEGMMACASPTKATVHRYCVVMDADFQHPPEKVGDIIHALRDGADLAVGVRESLPGDWPISRRLISRGAILLGNCRLLLSGRVCRDIASGFFGCDVAVAQRAINRSAGSFEMPGYKVLFDILKYGDMRRIGYVPYTFALRKHGDSKLGKKHIVSFLKALVK